SLGSGTIDAGFNAFLPSTYGGSNNDIVWSTAMQADGKLLLALDSYGEDQSAVRRVFSGINQVAGRVEFTSGSYSGIEEGNVTIDVQRVGGSAGAVSVSYSTYAGTAVEGTDYPLTTGVLNWGNGDTSTKSIVIAIPNDGLVEPNENFIIQLGTPLGGTWLGETAQALVSIDDAPTATIDPESMTVTSAAQSYPIDVTSSASWTPLESADWVTVNPPSGSGNGTVTVTVAQNPATSQRSTVISIGGRSHVLTQEGAAPFVAIDPASHTVDSTAQPYQIDVTSNTDWTVTESLDWVSVDVGGGSGDETLTVSVLANPSASPRSGDIDIGGQTHHLTQQGATPYTVPQPLSKTVDHEAQSYTFNLLSNTNWTITESLDWVTVDPVSGTGDTTVTVTVSEHTAVMDRSGTIDVGGINHTLTQQGAPPFVTLGSAAQTVDHTAQTYGVQVTSNTDWSVVESLSWVTVDPVSGNGDGTVSITVEENLSLSSRAGNVVIGGKTHRVTQQASPPFVQIDPGSATVDHQAQSFPIAVSSNTSWTVTESLSWVSVAPKSGSKDGTVVVTVAANPATVQRSGTVTIGGQAFSLTQLDAPPFTDLLPTEQEVDRFAQTYQIAVTSNTDWTVDESLDWVEVSPASGNGNGTLTVT
ncbi:MAG: hypothetical protein KDM64_13985, partial [Verrucomicrobiae bacterium]|nr:hypothetical protein [Verrucomicrobiae bacterium]